MRYALLITAILLAGCASSDTREAVIPKKQSSVRYSPPDTMTRDGRPPASIEGQSTKAVTLEQYERPGTPPIIERLTVKDDSIGIQTREDGKSVLRWFLDPEKGEWFVAQGDTSGADTSLQAGVKGTTEPDTVDVLKEKDDSNDEGIFEQLKSRLAIVGGIVVLGVIGLFVSKLGFLPW